MATMTKAMPAVQSGISRKAPTAAGTRPTMPAKMMKLMPLPMPRSVISSPSHMSRIVPAVSVMIWVERLEAGEVEVADDGSPPWLRDEERQEAVGLERCAIGTVR